MTRLCEVAACGEKVSEARGACEGPGGREEAGGNVPGVRRGHAPRAGISIVQKDSGACSNGDGLDGKPF